MNEIVQFIIIGIISGVLLTFIWYLDKRFDESEITAKSEVTEK